MASKSLGTLTLDLVAKTGGFTQGMTKAERSSEKWRKQVERDTAAAASATSKNNAIIAASFVGLTTAAATFALKSADVWSDLSSQVRNSVQPQEQTSAVMARLSDIARGTYSSIESTTEAFTRNSVTLRALGKSTQDQLNYTEALNNALVVSGAKADKAQMVQDSLSKSMATGALRGQELNTVLNSGSRIAELLADELGVNITQLRALGADGKITGDVIYSSLTKNLELLSEEAERMPATIGDAFLLMRNAVLENIGVFDQQSKISERLAEQLVAVSDVVRDTDWEPMIQAVTVVASVIATRLVVSVGATGVAFGAAQIQAARYQLALASMSGVSAGAAVSLTSLSFAAKAASSAMALVGGPAGAIILAASALTYFATRASDAEKESAALDGRINDLGGSFDKLNSAQAAAAMVDYRDKLSLATEEMLLAEREVENLQIKLSILGIKNPEKIEKDLILARGAAADAANEVQEINEKLEVLGGIANRGAGKTLADDTDKSTEAFDKLNAQLREKLVLVGLNNEADKLAARIAGGFLTGLSEDQARAVIDLQKEIDIKEQAAAASKSAASAAASAAKSAASAQQSKLEGIAGEITALERAAHVWGMTTDELKIHDLTAQGATSTQLKYAESLLSTVAGLEKAKEEKAAYLEITKGLRTDEEKLTDEFRERIAVLDAMSGSYRISSDEYAKMVERASDAAFSDAPGFGGLSPEIGGPAGEFNKIDEAEEKLQEWYGKQLEMLEEFRSERADLTEQWDEKEADLHQQHQDKLADIEHARRVVQMAAGEEFFGNMAGAAKAFFGENSKLYKAAFAVEKAYAIGKALMNIPKSYSDAYAAVVGIPVVGPALAPVAGVAAAASQVAQAAAIGNIGMKGMAHDGIDSIPETGTWLLEKGERVTTAETSAKLDKALDGAMKSSSNVNVSVYEDASKAGKVERDESGNVNVYVSNIMQEGELYDAIGTKFGLRGVGS